MRSEPNIKESNPSASILVFGEVLYDCFPDGRRVLGGAPFNVAWHLKGLGDDPFFVSAVGKDEDGESVRKAMRDWGMEDAGLQTDEKHRTGTVSVEFNDGEPSYEIHAPRAWDRILHRGRRAAGLLYHGSLALRSEDNRSAFEAIRERSTGVRFFDLNLRPPHYTLERARQLIRGADWLKLNLDELEEISGQKNLNLESAGAVMQRMRSEFGVQNFLLTAGKDGACLSGNYGEARLAPAPAPEKVVDTVGAGDSFSAVAIHGILRRWDARDILERASKFAARVCGLKGATTNETQFYRNENHV